MQHLVELLDEKTTSKVLLALNCISYAHSPTFSRSALGQSAILIPQNQIPLPCGM